MNKDNLIPQAHKLTSEEKRLGGVNSSISRKEKKRALEVARDILSMPVDNGSLTDVDDVSSLKDASEVTLDVLSSILAKLAQKSINGDVKACKMLLTISGDYTERQEVKLEAEEEYSDVDFYMCFWEPDLCEATYLNAEGKRIKTIYGVEARDLYFKMMKNGEINGLPEGHLIGVDDEDDEDDEDEE